MNAPIINTINNDDGKVTFSWHSEKIIDNLHSFQVYGFCLNDERKVCLVRDRDEKKFTLPGGRVDTGETAREALIREFQEEAQFLPEEVGLLGSLEVKVVDKNSRVTDHHQQIRFVCKIHNVPDFIAGKDGWETKERIFVDVEKLPDYIDWLSYPTGKAQFSDFLKYLER
jgi:ADP-ribose pyrophosphatase YjhB (NUDIX family)